MDESYSEFCECGDSYSEFISISTRKAKKAHRCDECHAPIYAGEVYEYATGKQEGDMWWSKTCPRCKALMDWIQAHVPCFCRMYGGFFEDPDRLGGMVQQARQTPGFAFGILRRVAAIKKHRDQCFQRRAVVASQAAASGKT